MKQALAAVTGLGAVHPFGAGVERLWAATLAGEAGCPRGFGEIPRELCDGKIEFPAVADPALAHRLENSQALRFGLLAAREAIEQAGWATLGPGDGLILGTTTGQAAYWEKATMDFLRDCSQEEFAARFTANPLGLLASDLATLLGQAGPRQTIASACCASTEALAIGAQWIASGKAKRVLVGGVELLCELTKRGFQSLQLVAEGPCRPFDANRAGINLSEAAAFLCLEAPSAPKALAQLRGFGIAGDASHMTAPHPEGDGCRRAIEAALGMAGLAPAEIGWVHAHGTGSRHNDVAETRALRSVFGASPPPATSTKAVHGHALGAAGALEAVLVCHALGEQLLLPSHGLETQDPEIDYPVQRKTEKAGIRHALKTTLAFGGVNAALIFSAAQNGTAP